MEILVGSLFYNRSSYQSLSLIFSKSWTILLGLVLLNFILFDISKSGLRPR